MVAAVVVDVTGAVVPVGVVVAVVVRVGVVAREIIGADVAVVC